MGDVICWLLVVGAFGVCTFAAAFLLLRQARRILNMPTSKCAGITLGLTELKGACEAAGPLLTSPLAGRPCVHFSFTIEEWKKDAEGYGPSWESTSTGTNQIPFLVRDETGAATVLPERAEFQATERFRVEVEPGVPPPTTNVAANVGLKYRRRFTEFTIEPGDALYVMGTATPDDATGLPYIGRSKDGEPFVISTRPEARVRRGYIRGGLASLAAAIFVTWWGFALPLSDVGVPAVLAWSGTLLLALAATAAMWVSFLYNDLVWVREQMRKALGNLDADLVRRGDLIPNLVKVVQAYAEHERDLFERVVQARISGDIATSLNDQTRALAALYGVGEKYPQLKSDAMFLDLMRRLVAVENRIALARTFHNDTVTAYNTRMRSLPDVLLAAVARFHLQPILRLEAFDHRPVDIRFDPAEEWVRARGAG